jgi:hypothetical protein
MVGRRWVSFILAVFLALGVSACGDSSNGRSIAVHTSTPSPTPTAVGAGGTMGQRAVGSGALE